MAQEGVGVCVGLLIKEDCRKLCKIMCVPLQVSKLHGISSEPQLLLFLEIGACGRQQEDVGWSRTK